jgi:ketosteroid isomerase-like protein
MSQENVEIVHMAFEAFVGGDVPAFLSALGPDIEWKQMEELEPRHGHEGVVEAIGQWHQTWDDPHYAAEEYIDGGDHVILLLKLTGRGKTSGASVDMSSYLVFTLREGKIIRMNELGPGKRSEALKAVGLSK